MVGAHVGGAREDLDYLFNDLNDGLHDALAACHGIEFANRQFAGFAIEHFVIHVAVSYLWEGTIPSGTGGRSDLKIRSMPFIGSVMHITISRIGHCENQIRPPRVEAGQYRRSWPLKRLPPSGLAGLCGVIEDVKLAVKSKACPCYEA
jgi:hypothetical protein